jgi:hypothetical protein
VEGDYYINSSTGEIIGDRWNDATVHLNGSTYAYVQPADSIPDHGREQYRSDGTFVYNEATDSFYRYDRRYGSVAPTNIGRHPDILEAYTWKAENSTTHHGVPVITYRATGTRTHSRASPISSGTLLLGAEDGVIYGFDVSVDAGDRTYRYTYDVEPALFPDHDWVDRARDVTAENTRSTRSPESK